MKTIGTILGIVFSTILISALLATIPTSVFLLIGKQFERFYETRRASGFRRAPAIVCLAMILVLILCIAGTHGVWMLIEYITTKPEGGLVAPIVPIHMQIMEKVEVYTTILSLMISVASLVLLAIYEMEWRKENKKKEERPLET